LPDFHDLLAGGVLRGLTGLQHACAN